MKFTKDWVAEMTLLATRFPQGRVPMNSEHAGKRYWEKRSKQAAVFLPLCNRHGVASVLFTIRSNLVSTHKGQVSFPGGHMELGESEVDAAHRETFEELGHIGSLHTIGFCEMLPAKTMTPVHPVIGFIEQDVGDFEHFSPSVGEVERVFTRSIEQLLDPKYVVYEDLQRFDKEPDYFTSYPIYGWSHEYQVEGSVAQQERIYGITAKMLETVLEHVIKPTIPAAYR